MIRITLSCALLLLSFCTSYSQVVFEKMINTGISSSLIYENMMSKRVSMSNADDCTYVYALANTTIEKKEAQQKQTIYCISANNKVSQFTFSFPEKMGKAYYKDITFLRDEFVLMTSSYIYKYQKVDNEYILQGTLENTHNFNDIDVLNDSTIIVSVAYTFHPRDQEEKVAIATINTNLLEYQKKIFPSIDGIEYSYFNHNWVCAKNNQVIYVDNPLTYSIKVYNEQLVEQQTIKINHDSWVVISDSSINEVKKYRGKDQLYIAKSVDSNISRILKVFFLSDSMLFVLYKLNGVYQDYYYDIIELKSNSYNMITSQNLMKKHPLPTEYFKDTRFLLRSIHNSNIDVLPGSDGRSFYLPALYYYPIKGDETVEEIRSIAGKYRKRSKKEFGLNKFTF